jgi:hypothetical protein
MIEHPDDATRARWPGDPAAGARNLLVDCAGVGSGDRVLIITEPDRLDHYDLAVARCIAEEARKLGAHTTVLATEPGAGPEDVPSSLLEEISRASHTIFLNRIGDQLRFAPLPGAGTKTVCYTLDLDYLGSAFAVSPYRVWEKVRQQVVERISRATRYSIRCPLGTDLLAESAAGVAELSSPTGFTVKNFPVMIVPPVSARHLSGRLVLSHTLTSTGVHSYKESVLPLESPLELTLDHGHITRFDGPPALVARVRAQFERVASLFGGTGDVVNSWHAGINPFTWFLPPALSDIDRWSAMSFGSPRYAHFHLCGSPPGDICGQVFDATIAFDDEVIWNRGRLDELVGVIDESPLRRLGLPPGFFDRSFPLGV